MHGHGSSNCEVCEKVFNNQSEIEEHIRISHSKPSPKDMYKPRRQLKFKLMFH